MTYTNNQNPADATCSFTLEFGYQYNDVTQKCDKKSFTVTQGQCTLKQSNDCSGAGDCNCKFNVSGP